MKNGGHIRLVLRALVFSGVLAPFYILGAPLDRSIALPVPFVLLCLPSPPALLTGAVMAVSKCLGSFGWFITFSGL